MANRDTVRKVKLEDVSLTVTVEPQPDDMDAAIRDALAAAHVSDYTIRETFEVEPYGNEGRIGRSDSAVD